MKQVDEALWKMLDIEKAKSCLYTYPSSPESRQYLKEFFRILELLKKSEVKQVPKLLEKAND